MIQIDGAKRQVHIKLIDIECVQTLLQGTFELAEYKHTNGEISTVRIDNSGTGTRKRLIANLPPDVAEDSLRSTLAPKEEILSINDEP